MPTRLFHEILSYIMVLAQMKVAEERTGSASESSLPPRSQPFEIVISHVNSSLRYVALHTSRLWSSPHLGGFQDQRITLERITAYIKRSGGHLLDVRIEMASGSIKTWEARRDLNRALELIASQSRRWRRLSIVTDTEEIATVGDTILVCLNEAETLVPELEYLSVSMGHDDETEGSRGRSFNNGIPGTGFGASQTLHLGDLFPRVTLSSPPKLAFFRLRGLALYLLHLNQLSSLRVLHLDQTKALPIPYALFRSVLQSCPLLKHLSIYGDIDLGARLGTGGTGNGGGHPLGYDVSEGIGVALGSGMRCWPLIRLPELRSLRICGTRGLVYGILLSEIEAPELESLVLKDVQEHDLDTLWEGPPTAPTTSASWSDGGSGLPRASAKFSSRFTQMRSLIISNSDLSEFVYRQLFKAFPAITEFASYSSMEIDVAPKLFMDDDRVNVPWPNLHMMTFIFSADLEEDDEMIEKMLSRRRKSGCPIHKLRIGVAEVNDEERVKERGGPMSTVVVVEKMDEYDVWPTDRLYPDVDDILF